MTPNYNIHSRGMVRLHHMYVHHTVEMTSVTEYDEDFNIVQRQRHVILEGGAIQDCTCCVLQRLLLFRSTTGAQTSYCHRR